MNTVIHSQHTNTQTDIPSTRHDSLPGFLLIIKLDSHHTKGYTSERAIESQHQQERPDQPLLYYCVFKDGYLGGLELFSIQENGR